MSQPSLKRAAIRTLSRVVRRVVIGRVPGLFDTAYYLKHNGDVAASGIDPYLHYVWRGAAENRDPAEDFDTRRASTQCDITCGSVPPPGLIRIPGSAAPPT
jgi:hypothetical protein